MAAKLSDLASIGRWLFESKTLGAIDVGPVSIGAIRRLKELEVDPSLDDASIAREVIKLLGRHAVDGPALLGKGEPLSAEEVELLDNDELTRFAELFGENNRAALERAATASSGEDPYKVADESQQISFKNLSMRSILKSINRDNENQVSALGETIRRISRPHFSDLSTFGSLGESLAKQSAMLDQLKPARFEPPPLRDFHIPPNPIEETNDRLQSLEERLQTIIDIGGQGMTTATALQAVAGEFLVKFEKEARSNNRAVKFAIGISILAILLQASQILYSEVWKSQAETEAQQRAIAAVQGQLESLQLQQTAAANNALTSNQTLIEAVIALEDASADDGPRLDEMAATLREIASLLGGGEP